MPKHNEEHPDASRKIRTSVGLDPSDYEEVERLAEQKRVSIAWVVREAVKEYLGSRRPLFTGREG